MDQWLSMAREVGGNMGGCWVKANDEVLPLVYEIVLNWLCLWLYNCGYTENYCTVHFKWLNCVAC